MDVKETTKQSMSKSFLILIVSSILLLIINDLILVFYFNKSIASSFKEGLYELISNV